MGKVVGWHFVEAFGNGNLATTVGGHRKRGYRGLPRVAVDAEQRVYPRGADNQVVATPGPFNVAGVVNQPGKSMLNNIH
jgi:hypothetical protein